MPQADTVATPRHFAMQRFSRILRLLAVLSILLAAAAVILAMRGEEAGAIQLLIATALAAGLAVLIGSASMTLVLLSSRNARDGRCASHPREGTNE